mmetsp:Transcript_30649/g.33499  ORF Transcript_30649/g.33499 Transcript_30649/m.33499 type:complete len:87 (-) Transcript_30649:75-335(-)|eukprot:gene7824-8460_t
MDQKKAAKATATPSKSTVGATQPANEKKSVLELLEEDDEFEEFEGTAWEDQVGSAEDQQLWKDDWEDDDVNDDFTQQLRAQIESRK